MFGCTGTCDADPDPDACLADCISLGTEEARAQFGALFSCIDESPCATVEECRADCGAEERACIEGGLDCAGLLGCLAPCEEQACADACFAEGNPGAAETLDALIACQDAEGCDSFETCEPVCGEQIAACVGEPAEG